MKTKAIIATGLVTLALLAGCNKEKESTSTHHHKSVTTTPAPTEEPATTKTQESTSTTTKQKKNNIRFAGSQSSDWEPYLASSGFLQWGARAKKASSLYEVQPNTWRRSHKFRITQAPHTDYLTS